MTKDEIEKRYKAYQELEKLEKSGVPYRFNLELRKNSSGDSVFVDIAEGHGNSFSEIAFKCFANKIAEGLKEYQEEIKKIAEGRDSAIEFSDEIPKVEF